MRITVLGSGTSHGIPRWDAAVPFVLARPPRPADRCSIVVGWRGATLLVDTPPELRHQVIRCHVTRVDALLFTHSHADHIFGLDDVRRFNEMQGGDLAVFSRPDTLGDIERTFRYVLFLRRPGVGSPGSPSPP